MSGSDTPGPVVTQGQVWTVAQWNAFFASLGQKVDAAGGTATNLTIIGGSMVGVTGAGAVASVAGRTGDVVLSHTDITDWTAALAAGAYTLPAATLSARGGVKPDGTTITITGDVISSVGGGAVASVAGRTGAVTLTHTDLTDWAAATSGFGAGYTLPAGTSTVLGGVKPDGTTIANTAGAISVAYGTTAATAAQGNDARIVAAQTASQVATAVAAETTRATGAEAANLAAIVTNTAAIVANVTAIGALAPKDSPTFTGTVTIPAGAAISGFATSASVTTAVATETTRATTAEGLLAPKVNPTLTGPFEVRVAMAANNIDCGAASFFTKTIAALTTFTVSNVPASGVVASFVLELTNGGAFAITWWSGMHWPGGTAPALTAAGIDVIGFYTMDAGTNWRGLLLGKGMA